jgi:aspartate aminotransferase
VTINNSNEFCEYILMKGFVAVVTGSAFGADNCFRFSYAASEPELREAVRRIAEVVSKLK